MVPGRRPRRTGIHHQRRIDANRAACSNSDREANGFENVSEGEEPGSNLLWGSIASRAPYGACLASLQRQSGKLGRFLSRHWTFSDWRVSEYFPYGQIRQHYRKATMITSTRTRSPAIIRRKASWFAASIRCTVLRPRSRAEFREQIGHADISARRRRLFDVHDRNALEGEIGGESLKANVDYGQPCIEKSLGAVFLGVVHRVSSMLGGREGALPE